ncbi:nitrate/nitrite transporter NrtS [Ralstonia pickettii]|nr:nitrate/nitrite transporter NrtS [Ralstonia pickettii]
MMTRGFRLWFSSRIATSAIRIALFVGTVLNIINQGGAIFSGHDVDWWRLGLNYLVPYLVSSYSAVRNELNRGRNE